MEVTGSRSVPDYEAAQLREASMLAVICWPMEDQELLCMKACFSVAKVIMARCNEHSDDQCHRAIGSRVANDTDSCHDSDRFDDNDSCDVDDSKNEEFRHTPIEVEADEASDQSL